MQNLSSQFKIFLRKESMKLYEMVPLHFIPSKILHNFTFVGFVIVCITVNKQTSISRRISPLLFRSKFR